MKELSAFILGMSLIVLMLVGMAYLDTRDAALSTQANCVAATAKAEGYQGNVYGPETYDLFISKCR